MGGSLRKDETTFTTSYGFDPSDGRELGRPNAHVVVPQERHAEPEGSRRYGMEKTWDASGVLLFAGFTTIMVYGNIWITSQNDDIQKFGGLRGQ